MPKALVVGLLYASSVSTGVSEARGLVDTVGGALQKKGRAGDLAVTAAVWTAAVSKVVASVLPLAAVTDRISTAWRRIVWVLSWAVILIAYGVVLTTVGLLVQANAIHASATADHRAMAWHAYLWDPWFLVWDLLVAAAL